MPVADDAVAPTHDVLPMLRVGYEDDVVYDDSVLAVIGFGRSATSNDPRFLNVALEPLAPDETRCEVWRTRNAVAHGIEGHVRWCSDGTYSIAVVELRESSFGGIAETARLAYAELVAWVQSSATPNLLRIWNYFDAINDGHGDAERYRQFCSGRAAGLGPAFAGNYPAASAIGTRSGKNVLQVYALASRICGVAVENPRQCSAWRYPRQYGPTAPGFARGMRAPTQFPQLYISGTAAVVGHESHHAGDIEAQLQETLMNLESLLQSAQSRTALGNASGDVLKVYVRRADDAAWLQSVLRSRLGNDISLLMLHGDICRAELLLEIDGIHAG
ncbi:MAG TPA: pteridine-dependent deoxygenase [Rudaea sp.]|nr:pteridine-dependent deoxygenase [Rudaea sp.]